jgi:hypothetical protein
MKIRDPSGAQEILSSVFWYPSSFAQCWREGRRLLRHRRPTMAQQSPTSAMLAAGLAGTTNPYLARYRAGVAAQDSRRSPVDENASPARLWTEQVAEAQAVSLAPAPAPSRPLDASIETCNDLLKALQTDLLSVPTATFSSKFSSRATVGVMFHGNIIESMVVGGPAFNCQELDRGDELLRVDGQPVTEQNRHRLLIGSDLPGSQVTLTVRKASGATKDVVLSRMKSEQIADKRRIFELFTTILDLVAGYDERQVLRYVCACVGTVHAR